MNKLSKVLVLIAVGMLVACGSSSTDSPGEQGNGGSQGNVNILDQQLLALTAEQGITGDPTTGLSIPSIEEPISQLGMKLFYSKSLGGEMDSACVTCHHPSLGGTDNLSLGVGVEALDVELLGPGRQHISGEFTVPRNAPTTFNSALYRKSLFWDSRITRLDGGIRTPESPFGVPDSAAGESLLDAQAKFPVTSAEEMRTDRFEEGSTNTAVRHHLAARVGGYDGGYNAQDELDVNNWLSDFQLSFGTSETAESLVSYNNIASALAAYEASQVFVNNPWNRYVKGDANAISDDAKRGALLFFTAKENGGGDCSRCHQGDLFSDESHHVVAFPQIGVGKGDGATGDDDFGLARESSNENDRYKFRTPSLLNIAITAPYGHTGAYQSLRDVVRHYDQPRRAVQFFDDNDWCVSISNDNGRQCNTRFPNARTNTILAQRALNDQLSDETIDGINLNNNEISQIVEFLQTLTDPCTQNRECISPWIPEATGGPDGNQLNGVDQFGNDL